MSEKRKPEFVILLKLSGKKTKKVEAFSRKHWPNKTTQQGYWRLRVNGRWWPKNEFRLVTKTQLKELFFKAIPHEL